MLFAWCLGWFSGELLCYGFRVVGYCVGGGCSLAFRVWVFGLVAFGDGLFWVLGFVACVMVACL